MEQWISDYNAKCGANLNAYGGGGSGKGIADFIANQVDFAGSDSALNADQASQAKSTRCAGNDAINLPMVTGPIALAYNLSGRRQADPDPGGAGRDLRRHDHELERPDDRRDQPGRDAARAWRSRPCTARRTPAPRTTSPST